MMQNHFSFPTKFLFAGGDKVWSKEKFLALIVDIYGRLSMVPPDLHFVHNAKALTFIGRKKIEAMPGEAAKEKVVAALVNLR
jgi:hypothetical protein